MDVVWTLLWNVGTLFQFFIQQFNVANALRSWSLQCLEKVHNLHLRKATRQATTVRFVPLHQPKYLWRLPTVVCSDGQQCVALYNTAVFTSDAKNIQYSSIKCMLWKVNSIMKLEKKSTWCSQRFQMDNHKCWFKRSAVRIQRAAMAASEWDKITFYRSFIHNIMAVKTQMSTTLPTYWMHEAFTVAHYRFVWCVRTERLRPDHHNRVCIKNKQATADARWFSRSTPWVRSEFCDVCMYKSVCVCVLWLFIFYFHHFDFEF